MRRGCGGWLSIFMIPPSSFICAKRVLLAPLAVTALSGLPYCARLPRCHRAGAKSDRVTRDSRSTPSRARVRDRFVAVARGAGRDLCGAGGA